jgi:hypothetical protein
MMGGVAEAGRSRAVQGVDVNGYTACLPQIDRLEALATSGSDELDPADEQLWTCLGNVSD